MEQEEQLQEQQEQEVDVMQEDTFRDVLQNWKHQFLEWYYDLWIVIWFMDIINYFRFKKEFKEEDEEPESRFHELRLKRNKFGNVLYAQYNFTEKDLMYADYDVTKMVMRRVEKIVAYISETMGWGEYVSIDIKNFLDDKGDPTLSYGFVFQYMPKVFTFKGLFKFIGWALLAGGVAALICWVYSFLLAA
jgi:hypothetical protein